MEGQVMVYDCWEGGVFCVISCDHFQSGEGV